jgi:hypothetical protein
MSDRHNGKEGMIRIDEDLKIKLKTLKKEIEIAQEQDIPLKEVLRRTINIPNLKNVLIEDAKAKKRMNQ